MCTVVLLIRPGHAWPLVFAANRDEMLNRAWDPPAAHWPDQPGVTAGRDRSGGGTWMGVNRAGVVAAVLNRPGSLGPADGKRSRGELPLLALAHRSADAAAGAIAALDATDWRSFNLVFADAAGAILVRGSRPRHPEVQRLAPGLRMITAHDPDDRRARAWLGTWRGSIQPPRPVQRFRRLADILADRTRPPRRTDATWCRVEASAPVFCSSLLALRRYGRRSGCSPAATARCGTVQPGPTGRHRLIPAGA